MKTCPDCVYCYQYDIPLDKPFECRLYPQAKRTQPNYWCGQLKVNKAIETEKYESAKTSLDDLNINLRAKNILLAQGIDIHKLRTMSKVDLLKIPQCGTGTTDNILEALYRDGGMKS